MPESSDHGVCHGYTLIEILAVVLIMGMVAVTVGPLVVRNLAQDPFMQSIEAMRDLDGEARVAAHSSPVVLELRPDGIVATDRGRIVGESRCMSGMQLTWSGAPGQRVALDDRGRSVDLKLHVHAAGRTMDYRICGLTGSWLRMPAP